MYPKSGKDGDPNNGQMYMDQYDYMWGNQMYGGAFDNQEFSQPQPHPGFGKPFGKKDQPAMAPGPGPGMYYPQDGSDWNYEDPAQVNYQPGFPQQKMYQQGKKLGKDFSKSFQTFLFCQFCYLANSNIGKNLIGL